MLEACNGGNLGRPTLITDDLTKRFCDMIKVSGSIETAIARTGIGRETYFRWLRKVRKGDATPKVKRFIAEVQKTESDLKERRESELAKRRPDTWQIHAAWLARHYPEEYGPRRPPQDREPREMIPDEGIVWLGPVSSRSKKSKPTIPLAAEGKTEAQGHVVIVGGDIEGAKPIRQVQPVYPAQALEQWLEDVVTFDAIIGAHGTIQNLRLVSGEPLFISSVVQALKYWMYSPTVISGKTVEMKTTIEFRFTLTEVFEGDASLP